MYAKDKILYQHIVNYIRYEYNTRIQKKDRQAGNKFSIIGNYAAWIETQGKNSSWKEHPDN